MCAKVDIAILGKPYCRHELHYIAYLLSMPNVSLKYISDISEAKNYSALILLEKIEGDLLIELLEEKDIKVLLEIPFANSFEEEVELLRRIRELDCEVFLPLLSRHHPTLVRFKAILQRKVLGEVFSIYITLNFSNEYLREEPSLKSSSLFSSGKILHQLVNTIDYVLWLDKDGDSQIDVWTVGKTKEREFLIVDAKLGNTLLTILSYACENSSSSHKGCIKMEAVGFEKMLVWSGYEQSLILEGDSTLDYIHWSTDPNEIIAKHFLEIIKGKSQYNLKDVFKSYEETLKFLQSNKIRKSVR
ncbi:MAG: hypothetical protein QXT92_03665 [Nitrososphaerota archaeon]